LLTQAGAGLSVRARIPLSQAGASQAAAAATH
jgi:hypothetical protein